MLFKTGVFVYALRKPDSFNSIIFNSIKNPPALHREGAIPVSTPSGNPRALRARANGVGWCFARLDLAGKGEEVRRRAADAREAGFGYQLQIVLQCESNISCHVSKGKIFSSGDHINRRYAVITITVYKYG